ncbi:MAG: penicillin-binding protein [Fluviicola sp. XM-24bin1]|nr:MAG: penicillin-binding protein [Fluviicola sp. XM-24bin1]
MKKEPKSEKLQAAWYWVTGRNSDGTKKQKTRFAKRTTWIMFVSCWLLALTPIFVVWYMFASQPEEDLPSVASLENPPELLASIVYADDGKTELGRYWSVNRTTVDYNEISPYVIDALISTEDERYLEHAGIDFRALMRAVANMGEAGGASTISQQLAKLLFTLQKRDKERALRAAGKPIPNQQTGIMRRINEKIQENIIAVRLEERYTKKEIITMYLNQFDFLYNAVGIENAAKVYFNKKPIDLTKDEAAMLVGMCKNPSLYNPYSYKIKNYRPAAARSNGISMEAVTESQMQALRTKDSLRSHLRRDQVLKQWLKNSKSKNKALQNYITQAEYDTLRLKTCEIDYQVVDHKQGIAPYFRESLRADLTALFEQKNADGSYKYAKKDGSPYNIYNDGLRIYTTINVEMQEYAEAAMKKHLKEDLQPAFEKNNAKLKNFPFANNIKEDVVKNLMKMGRGQTERYRKLKQKGATEKQILEEFSYPVPMRVFTWDGEVDTVMSPDDSIRYYKSILRSSLMSMEPSTGFVKAWVGGIDFNHFAFDQVKQGKRQVGSTIKPFVYATALQMGTSMPCTKYEEGSSFCVDVYGPNGKVTKTWCPAGKIPSNATMEMGLAASNNPITVGVMSSMGGYAGPNNIAKLCKDAGLEIAKEQIVPSMCLGVMDLSVHDMVAAQAMFVNQGIYVQPTTVLRIEDRNGNVIYSANPKSKEVLSSHIAHRTLMMMKGVVDFGTSTSLRWHQKWGGIKHPMAGKTGTTQSNSDGWFIGLTPDLVTGVWTGGEERAERFRSMTWGQGARMALPIYGYYMQKVYKSKKLKISTADFEEPIGYDPTVFECENNGGDVPDFGLD